MSYQLRSDILLSVSLHSIDLSICLSICHSPSFHVGPSHCCISLPLCTTVQIKLQLIQSVTPFRYALCRLSAYSPSSFNMLYVFFRLLSFLQVAWTFGLYLEAVAVLPQLFMFQKQVFVTSTSLSSLSVPLSFFSSSLSFSRSFSPLSVSILFCSCFCLCFWLTLPLAPSFSLAAQKTYIGFTSKPSSVRNPAHSRAM